MEIKLENINSQYLSKEQIKLYLETCLDHRITDFQILKDSSMPDEEKGNVILAAHSGNARISYFKNLDKLVIGDDISIEYNSVIYNYKVIDIYLIDKTGTAEIIRDKNKSALTLITCKHNTNKQIIVIAELI